MYNLETCPNLEDMEIRRWSLSQEMLVRKTEGLQKHAYCSTTRICFLSSHLHMSACIEPSDHFMVSEVANKTKRERF